MEDQIKKKVKEAYANVALGKSATAANCCSLDTIVDEQSMALDYDKVEGHFEEADLGLGCGIPTDNAQIKAGDVVIDLGSGAGNDVFIARQLVGESGKVIGVDMTEEMHELALKNKAKLGYTNVDFILNDIEDMKDVKDNTANVVISNCVLNLVPDKKSIFAEIHRVLKMDGHFNISDIVYKGDLPDVIKDVADLHAGCISGASEKGAYLGFVKEVGFKDITVKSEREIILSDDLLLNHISAEELKKFRNSETGIFSVTVYAKKSESGSCCVSSESKEQQPGTTINRCC